MSTTTKNNTTDGVCDMLNNISTADKEDDMPVCANCGKEGSNVTNTCNKCKSVKYCNAACKKKHRHKHKKECERRVAELHDEKLFKQPPSKEDCPICMITLPLLPSGRVYMACCGKIICRGCIYAVQEKDTVVGLCPFCRTPPPPSNAEMTKMYNKRIELNDANAMYNWGCRYRKGDYGQQQNHAKALKLFLRAGELGHTDAYYGVAKAYIMGRGVERDEKKAIYYLELSAIRGEMLARHKLGLFEERAGNANHHRALKHFKIAAGGGNHNSLMKIQGLYTTGDATKDDFETALRSYQAYVDEIRSEQRDEAAAANDGWKYYESAF